MVEVKRLQVSARACVCVCVCVCVCFLTCHRRTDSFQSGRQAANARTGSR